MSKEIYWEANFGSGYDIATLVTFAQRRRRSQSQLLRKTFRALKSGGTLQSQNGCGMTIAHQNRYIADVRRANAGQHRKRRHV